MEAIYKKSEVFLSLLERYNEKHVWLQIKVSWFKFKCLRFLSPIIFDKFIRVNPFNVLSLFAK